MKAWKLWGITAVMTVSAITGALLTATPLPPASEAPPAVYRVVGVWDGQVAVFLPSASTPEQVYDAWVAALPEDDRRRLEAGIDVYSAAELQARVEDYTS